MMKRIIFAVVFLVISVVAFYIYFTQVRSGDIESKGPETMTAIISLATGIVSLATSVVSLVTTLKKQKN